MSALWFNPVCDQALLVIAKWYANYENGEVYSDRKWMNLDGVVVDRPTRYAHKVAFRPIEIQHIVRIMEALAPKSKLTSDLRLVQANLRTGQLKVGGTYAVTLAYYKQDIKDIYEVLVRARSGELETLADTLAKQKQDGKELFEE